LSVLVVIQSHSIFMELEKLESMIQKKGFEKKQLVKKHK